jgi:PAS domain S-box-containing protein
MTETIRILMAEDLQIDAELAEREIKKVFKSCLFRRVETREAFLSAITEFQPDLIISDYHMPVFDGLTALKLAMQHAPLLPVIILTGAINEDTAVECMKAGAADYVIKEHIKRLGQAVVHALEEKEVRRQRRQTETALRHSEERYRMLVHMLPDAVTTADLQGRVTYASSVALRFWEFESIDEVLGVSVFDWVHPSSLQKAQFLLQQVLQGTLIRSEELLLVKRDGKVFYGEVSAASLNGPDNQALGVSLIVRDISERKCAEEELRRSTALLLLAYDDMIEALSRALDLRDKETEGHTRRVIDSTLQLAAALGIEGEELVHIRRGAFLHDLGKIGIPDEILHKNGPLTPEQWIKMREHPQLAYDTLSSIEYLRRALDIPYCHHEKWDGSGYPQGLMGEEIPLTARLFAIVDVWDALTNDRPYRPAWSEEKTLAYIREQSGKHFDPHIVEVFLRIQPHFKTHHEDRE